MQKRLNQARQNDKQLAQISMDVARSWQHMRICVANGYLLCNEELETKLFESITVYTWDANEQRWKGSRHPAVEDRSGMQPDGCSCHKYYAGGKVP